MNLIDLILNVALIFFWMDWRSTRTAKPQSALSLASTVRPAGDKVSKGFGSMAALAAILLVRPLFYYSIGPAVNWTPTLNFLAIAIPWRSDALGRMCLFSFLSFGKTIGFFYAWLLLLSAVNRKVSDEDAIQRFVRGQLGWLEKIPWWLKLLLPSLAAGLTWLALVRIFVGLELMPAHSADAQWQQAAAFALSAILAWKWFLVGLFLLHMLNIYVYVGTHPLWAYVSGTARRILVPLKFLHIGKLDLAPVVAAAGVLAFCYLFLEPLVVNTFKRFIA